jgi:PTH1 family peptidyl-tRNA hydrolase
VRIVLGLGNPGRRYAHTRHNVGFRVADTLAARLGGRFQLGPAGDQAEVARARVGGEEIVIAKPQTWMNNSGMAASRLAAVYGASPSETIVAYDDVALPLGTIRVRPSGRSAGQKGMESVIRALGTDAIPRVRLGILGERGDADLADYVLESFLPEERETAATMVERATEAVLTMLEDGVEKAMNSYNRRESEPG